MRNAFTVTGARCEHSRQRGLTGSRSPQADWQCWEMGRPDRVGADRAGRRFRRLVVRKSADWDNSFKKSLLLRYRLLRWRYALSIIRRVSCSLEMTSGCGVRLLFRSTSPRRSTGLLNPYILFLLAPNWSSEAHRNIYIWTLWIT